MADTPNFTSYQGNPVLSHTSSYTYDFYGNKFNPYVDCCVGESYYDNNYDSKISDTHYKLVAGRRDCYDPQPNACNNEIWDANAGISFAINYGCRVSFKLDVTLPKFVAIGFAYDEPYEAVISWARGRAFMTGRPRATNTGYFSGEDVLYEEPDEWNTDSCSNSLMFQEAEMYEPACYHEPPYSCSTDIACSTSNRTLNYTYTCDRCCGCDVTFNIFMSSYDYGCWETKPGSDPPEPQCNRCYPDVSADLYITSIEKVCNYLYDTD